MHSSSNLKGFNTTQNGLTNFLGSFKEEKEEDDGVTYWGSAIGQNFGVLHGFLYTIAMYLKKTCWVKPVKNMFFFFIKKKINKKNK